MHRPYSRLCRACNKISILARNQARRHWVYSGHCPGIFIAPKNARNAETKRWSGAVPILLLALSALTTSAYTSLSVLQELNLQPQLLKALVQPLSHISCALVEFDDHMKRVSYLQYLDEKQPRKGKESRLCSDNLTLSKKHINSMKEVHGASCTMCGKLTFMECQLCKNHV
jgi:hypothetical protein